MTHDPDGLPARLRDRIFDGVLAELVESGIDEFSVARVARQAGIAQQVIDRHWPDGRVLLMEGILARAHDAVPIPDEGSLVRDLRQFARSLAGLTGTPVGRQRFRRLVPGGGDTDLSNVGPDFWAFQMAAMEQMFRQAAERSELRSDIDEALAARMLAAALTYDMVYNDSPTDPDYAQQVVRTFLHGVLTAEGSGLVEDLHGSEEAHALIRAAYDGIADPAELLVAVRDGDGKITDFAYLEVNQAACTQLQRSESELRRVRLTETLPDLADSGLLARYIQTMESGDRLEVDNFPYFSRRYDTVRRFDVRAVRVSADLLTLVWRDVSERYRDQQHAVVAARSTGASESRATMTPAELADIPSGLALRAVADALLDPQVLLDAVRDSTGHVVDFAYREVNQAACDYLGMTRPEILGRGAVEIMPGLKGAMLPDYVRCLQTGEPLIRDNFAYDNEVLQDTRRYDVRVTRATADSLVLTWRDITDRFRAAQDLARSRDLLRRSTDAMFNPQALVEVMTTPAGDTDLVLRDVNRAFCQYIDQDRSDLVDHSMLALFPNVIGAGLKDLYVRCAETGEPVVLDDVEYFTEFLNEPRRFDIRAAQVDVGLISLTVRDTTARFEAAQRLADSEQKYRMLAENSGDLVSHVRDGKVVWASPSAEKVLGAPPEYWIGREVREALPAEDQSAFDQRLAKLAAGEVVQQRLRVRSVDGVTHWTHLQSRPFYAADGRPDGFIAALRVIDDEVAAETAGQEARAQQARADALYRRSMDSAAVGMCLARPEGEFLQVNSALCEFFGYDAETLLKKTWIELTAPEYLQADLDHVAEMVAGRIENYRMVKQFIHADGHLIWGDVSVGCLRHPDGTFELSIGQIIDITAQAEAEQRLQRMARFDTLTGLANRAEVIARLHSALKRTDCPPSPLGVLFCDADGFKNINDRYGHAVGDVVLSTLATRIRESLRDGDTVGRMGGDEILVLLPGMPSIDQVTRVAEKIRRHAAEPFRVGGQAITVTLSIGAVLAAPGQTTSIVLARADSAMYAAKAQKNAVASFPTGEPS